MTPAPNPGFRPSAITAALAAIAVAVMLTSYLAGIFFS
jgi:hypothetical protein